MSSLDKATSRQMLRRCPDVMDINEMCHILGISTKTGYRLLKNGDITALKIGRTYRIPKVHLLAYLKIRPKNC